MRPDNREIARQLLQDALEDHDFVADLAEWERDGLSLSGDDVAEILALMDGPTVRLGDE